MKIGFLLSALLVWAVAIPAAEVRWENDIRAFEAADKTNPPPPNAVVFVGSSSIRLWTTLAEDFPELTVIRRGFGGAHIADCVRYADRIVIPYKPRMVVLYAGGNDVRAGKTAQQVAAHFQDFVAKVHRALPATRIVYLSLNPTKTHWPHIDKVREVNPLIGDYCRDRPQLAFVDAYAQMLGPDGKWRDDELRDDGTHLNAAGYKRWIAIIKPQLLKLATEGSANK